MWLLITVALADPVRCTATFTGPIEKCKLLGTVSVDGTGSSDAQATRNAQKALSSALVARVASVQSRNPNLTEVDFAGCGAATSRTLVCREDAALSVSGVCFAQFDDASCWVGDVKNWNGSGVEALERGRNEMCSDVDRYLDSLDYKDEAELRARCRASCLEKARVSCIAD